MPSKSKESTSANLSILQKEQAIRKINRFLQKLQQLDTNLIQNRNDPKISVTEREIDALLVNIFGHNTIEYERYRGINTLDSAPIALYRDIPINEVRQSINGNIRKAIATLESLKESFQDDIQDSNLDKPSRVLKAYSGLELHPKIAEAADTLYRNGHYANAVQDAVKALILYVKDKSGTPDQDGSSLMQHVFSLKTPILKFNSLQTQSDKDEQQGFMHLFTGAVLGIRNPRAHDKIVDDPEKALEFIAFISLLAKLADISKK